MSNYGNELKVQEQWYERLHDWEKALELYKGKQTSSPDDLEITIGQMRCLEALADWASLEELAKAQWNKGKEKDWNRMAPMVAAASWGLKKFDSIEEYVRFIPRDTQDGTFYRALICIQKGNFAQAETVSFKQDGPTTTMTNSF